MAIPASRITGYPSPVDVLKILRGDGTWDSVYNTIPDRSLFGVKLTNYPNPQVAADQYKFYRGNSTF